MVDQSDSLSPVDETPLLPLFNQMLGIIKEYKCFKASPSFFIVYAHENPKFPDDPADSSVVEEIIDWFGLAGCNVQSDRTPPAARAITSCQFCLLPYWAYPDKSVQYVIMCGSRLLGKYLALSGFSDFVREVVETYGKIRNLGEPEEKLHDSIKDIQKRYSMSMGGDFHHVLTEIALVKTRAVNERKASIITFHLNGTAEQSLPDYLIAGNDYLRTTLGHASNADGSKYRCFLEMLEKLGEHEMRQTGTADLIREMRKIYNEAIEFLRKDGTVQQSELEYKLHVKCLDWIKKQPPSSEIDVAGIKTALKKYASSLSIRTLLDEEFLIDQYSIELKETDASSQEKKTIDVAELFDKRPGGQEQKDKPQRILIQGLPGAGKTTLCRQILHHMDRQPWNKFRWVLWVPLRRFGQEKDLTTFLGKVYFEEHYDFANGLRHRIFNQDKGQTLLILDGWDEIHGASPEISERVSELASFENVIITSRSFSADMPLIDLNLEATGLSHYAMYTYLSDRAIGGSETAIEEIESFLSKNQPIEEAFRTPMLLNLLCSFWHKLRPNVSNAAHSGNLPTVTMLYQTMVTELWRKDLSAFVNPPCNREEASLLSNYYLNDQIQPESQCLGNIALRLFDLQESAMDRNSIDQIAEGDDQQGKHKWLAPNVIRTSFLHRDDLSKEPAYSFVHLTFQEFFAAQSLVKNPSALRFSIRRYKYDPRFSMVFRFVAGLLQADETDTQLENFFELVEAEPRDLLGPAHQRLVMHCLSQVQRPRLAYLRDIFEYRMKNWILFECEWRVEPVLVTELEFPDHIRKAVLEDETVEENIRRKILGAFRLKAADSPGIQSLMASWLQGNKTSSTLKQALLETWNYGIRIPDEVLTATKELLKDEGLDVGLKCAAVRFLEVVFRDRGVLPPDIIKILYDMLLQPQADPAVQAATFEALDGRKGLTEEVQESLDGMRNTIEIANRIQIDDVWSFSGDSNLPQEEIDAALTDLENDNLEIKRKAIATLGEQNRLSSDIVLKLENLLDDKDSDVRLVAAESLSKTPSLSEDDFKRLTTRLSAANGPFKVMVVRAVTRRDLPTKVIDALLLALKDESADVRAAAVRALAEQDSLSTQILQDMALLLSDQNEYVKGTAASVLVQRADLPQEILEALIPHIKIMPSWQMLGLGRQQDLPKRIVDTILSRITDPDWDNQRAAILSLGNQQAPSVSVLKAIAAKVNIPSDRVRSTVAHAISPKSKAAMLAALAEESPQFFNNLYQIALWRSFSEPLAWSFDVDHSFCENMVSKGDGVSSGRVLQAIRTAKKALKPATPPVSNRLE